MEHPGAQVISLGSGLDGRYFRVSGFGRWTDVDYPDMIALRRELMKGMLTDRIILIGSSVTDSFWWDKMAADDGPVLIVMEGLLMYLHQGEIETLFQALLRKYPHCRLLFDAYSRMAARGGRFQPNLRKAGAAVHWGMDAPEEIECACHGLTFRRKMFLTEVREIPLLPRYYRFMFSMAGKWPVVREAHRIFEFEAV